MSKLPQRLVIKTILILVRREAGDPAFEANAYLALRKLGLTDRRVRDLLRAAMAPKKPRKEKKRPAIPTE